LRVARTGHYGVRLRETSQRGVIETSVHKDEARAGYCPLTGEPEIGWKGLISRVKMYRVCAPKMIQV